MNRGIRYACCIAMLLASALPARATVSEYAEFYVPYARIQSDYICLSQQLMEAEFGIPLASILTGVFSETQTLRQSIGGNNTYQNINLLVDGSAKITPVLNFDRYHDNGIFDYSFTLDMAAFSVLNGDSAEGRQKTINTAKLAVIAIIKTAEKVHKPGKFRVWLRFENLPSSSDLSGEPIFSGKTDWPGWPFTAGSPLYKAYVAELIDKDC